MFLLGVTTVSPAAVVSDVELKQLIRGEPSDIVKNVTGVSSRRLSLPLDYIKATGNIDPLEGWKVAMASPTSLGVQAVRELLAKSGISIEQIGLMLGDTGTPYQTCPSEAQRVMGEFGVKAPAFDLVGGIGAIPHALAVLSRWSAERFPEYLVYLSTNTPSQQINYQQDPTSAALFGDAAVALLIGKSGVSAGKRLKIAYAKFSPEDKRRLPVVVQGSIRLNSEEFLSADQLAKNISAEIEALRNFDPKLIDNAVFIAPQLYATQAAEVLNRGGVAGDRIISGVNDIGFSFGASHGVALAKVWDELSQERPVVLMHCGDGQRGSVVLIAS
jgi:3-oxoacyl-[acyl-carrier-protein] synthase III